MIKHPRAAIAAIALLAASVALAGNPPKTTTPAPDPSTSSSSSSSSVGVGVGVGIGQGGKAHAQGGNAIAAGGEGGHGGNATAIGEGGAGGSAQARQTQTAEGGSARQHQSANNEGNSQTLSVSSSYRDRLQAPSSHAPAVYASHSCALGWSIGASGPGAGISGGKAKADPSCERREWARVLYPMNPHLALKVACSDPIVAAVVSEGDCSIVAEADEHSETVAYYAPPPDLSKYATKEELERAFRKTVAK